MTSLILAFALGFPMPVAGNDIQRRAGLEGHTDTVRSLAFSPDGRILATGSNDKTIRLWDVLKEKPMGVLSGHNEWVTELWFSGDGRFLVSYADDGVKIWSVEAEKERHTLPRGRVALSPDGKTMALSVPRENKPAVLSLVDLASGDISANLSKDGVWQNFSATAFSHDGSLVAAVVPQGNSAIVWSVPQGVETAVLSVPDYTSFLAFLPDGKSLVTVAPTIAAVWDVATGKQKAKVDLEEMGMPSSSVSPNGRFVAVLKAAMDDTVVKVFDSANGNTVYSLGKTGQKGGCIGPVFSKNGKLLVFCDDNAKLHFVDTRTWKDVGLGSYETDTFGYHYAPLAISPDWKTLAVGNRTFDGGFKEGGLTLFQLTGAAAAGIGETAAPAAVAKAGAASGEELRRIVQEAVASASSNKSASAERKDQAPSIVSDVDHPALKSAPRPDDFALVIGIEKYQDLPAATFAERDAEAVKNHLIAMGFPSRNVVLLSGERAGFKGIEKFLESWLPRNVDEKSRVFFYFSGHGAPDVKTGQAYLMPWDGDANFLENTGYPIKRLYDKLAALKAKEVTLALDACFSGAGGRSVLAQGARPLVAKVDTGSVGPGKLAVFAAADQSEITSTLPDQGHGIFTYYFLKGLGGAAKNGQGVVTVKALQDYLKPLVQDAARRQNRDQTPSLRGENGDRELARFGK